MRFWNLIPDESAPADGVLDIEGPIAEEDWFGDGSMTGSRQFRQALSGVGNVTVHINSPGGDVMAGAEIYSALREHSLNGKGKVTVIITALAASAASVIAMAGDEVLISPAGYMMIHNPWSIAAGDAREMRKTARTLDEIAEGLIRVYQTRTGKSRDELKRMLEAETWMSAGKAVDEGFADGIFGAEIRAAACVSASMTRATPESVRALCERWEKAKAETADAEPDVEPEEEPEEPETEPTEPDGEAEPERDPEEEPEEPETEPTEPDGEPEPEQDPEEAPDSEPEKDPEPEEDPEKEKENRKRAEIARRMEILSRSI